MNDYLTANACKQLSSLINNALRHDPATVNGIARLRGKVLRVESTWPPFVVNVNCHKNGVELTGTHEPAADIRLRGTALALTRLTLHSGDGTTFAGSGVAVDGDQDVLRSVYQLARGLDVDWEAALAELVGDIPAHLLGRAVRQTRYRGRDAARRATTGFADYIKHEAHLTPSPAEVAEWSAHIRCFADATERLAAHIALLQTRAGKTAPNLP